MNELIVHRNLAMKNLSKVSLVLYASILFTIQTLSAQNVQQRLNRGDSPFQILNETRNPVDSLYGKTLESGLIFYVDPSSGYTLVTTPTDVSQGLPIKCVNSGWIGSTPDDLKAGKSNTQRLAAISTNCTQRPPAFPGTTPNTSPYNMLTAAYFCDTLTYGGFNDWFLPSLDALKSMYTNLHQRGFGSFNVGSYMTYYWSSSLFSNDFGNALRFWDGVVDQYSLTSQNIPRPIRIAGAPRFVNQPSATSTANSITVSVSSLSSGFAALNRVWVQYTDPVSNVIRNIALNQENNVYIASIPNLVPNTPYNLSVSASNALGTTTANNISITTKAGAPSLLVNADSITANSAKAQLSILNNGGDPITARSICYQDGTAPFNCVDVPASNAAVLNTLAPATTYKVFANAQNKDAIGYSDTITFTTLAQRPSISALSVVNSSSRSARYSFSINNDGGSEVTSAGFITSLSTITDTIINKTTAQATTNQPNALLRFSQPNTTYYVRGFVLNAAGMVWTNELRFATSGWACGDSIGDVSGNRYATKNIGGQCWTLSDLKAGNFKNNSAISQLTDSSNLTSTTSAAYYVSGNSYLYNFAAVSDSRCLCPEGWSVPSYNNWIALINSQDNTVSGLAAIPSTISSTAGNALKSTTGWDSIPGVVGNNTSGFNAKQIPGIQVYQASNTTNPTLGRNVLQAWWASDASSRRDGIGWNEAKTILLSHFDSSVSSSRQDTRSALGVRCVQNP